MKKFAMFVAAVAMVSMVACSGNKAESTTTEEAPAKVEEAAPAATADSTATKCDSTCVATPDSTAAVVAEPAAEQK